MDQQVDQTQTQLSPELPAKSNPYKLFFFLILGIFFILIAGLVFFLSQNMKQQNSSALTPTPSTRISTPSPTAAEIKETGIPITANTVSYTDVNGDFYLQYRGKIYSYSPSETAEPVQVTETSLTNKSWIGLVNAPVKVDAFDEVFAFKKLPNNKDFLFIMRWHPDFVIYLHRDGKLTQLSKTTIGTSGAQQNVPKILALSDDSKYGAFTMYPCWNCGGSKPETMLINFQTKETKRIGKTSYFAWKTNGSYEYKEYIVTACPTPTGEDVMVGECSQDPQSLPMKSGSL